MNVGYEEKTYESYFNSELSHRSKVYFPAGQVQEGAIGFDSSAFSTSRLFWGRFHAGRWFSLPQKGVPLSEIVSVLEKLFLFEISKLPEIKANIIFQFKKPEYISSKLGKEYQYWKQEYYRYHIDSDQQRVLYGLDNAFQGHLLVYYACPAIRDVNQLVQVYLNEEIIKNSNFTRAQSLGRIHTKNTYVTYGTHSYACSEPEKIKSSDIFEELGELGEGRSEGGEENVQKIMEFVKSIEGALVNDEYYGESVGLLKEKMVVLGDYPLYQSLALMANIRWMLGIQWALKC